MATYRLENGTTLTSQPMRWQGEDWEAVDLEPDAGYALYRDLGATIETWGGDADVILQSADAYTAE